MAKIVFDPWDVFVSGDTYGLVINAETAFILPPDNSATIGPIPLDAIPCPGSRLSEAAGLVFLGVVRYHNYLEDMKPKIDVKRTEEIRFEFEGVKYILPLTARGSSLITLDDGRVLKVGQWISTLPPIPTDLTLQGNSAQIPIIARRMETAR